MAPAVRCPKSASKIAASANRRPVRRPRWRSASDTIDDDGHRAEVEPEEPLDCRRDSGADLGREGRERVPGPGHDPQPDKHAVVTDAHADGGAAEPAAPRRATVSHTSDSR